MDPARLYPRAHRCAPSRRRSLRASPRPRWRRVVDDKLVDLTYPLDRRRRVRIVTDKSPEALMLDPSQHRPPDGGRGDQPLPRRSVRDRPAHRRGVLLRLRRAAAVRARGPRGHRSQRCASWPAATSSTSGRCGRATRPSAFFGERGEPLKVQLIDEKTEGQSEVSVYTIKDKDTFVDFCVGPHVPSSGRLQGVQAADHVERLLEGRRPQPADAAAVRHRLPHARRNWRITSSGSRKPSFATTARSARTRSCSCSTSGRRAPPSGCRRARSSTTRSRELHARGCWCRRATPR